RYFWLDNSGFEWQFKYFGLRYALAALDEATLVVRVSDVWCSWNPMQALGPDGAPLPLSQRGPSLDEASEEEYERRRKAGEFGDDGFVAMAEEYGEPLEFATDARGRLAVQGGASYRVKLEKHPGGAGEPVDVLRKRVRVTDDRGAVWECVTHCTPEVFFEKLV